MDCLVVVAHPDDETIWMGGTIIRNKSRNWTILSLCRRDDNDRRNKFMRACTFLKAACSMSDLEDDHPERPMPVEEAKKRIIGMLKKFDYDCIYTHGPNGEYGHNRHKEVYAAVNELVRSGTLRCKKLCVFNYVRDGSRCVADEKSDEFVRLSGEELRTKKYLIEQVYGFNKGSFEELSCSGFESFNMHGE